MRIPLCSHSAAATHFIRRGLPARGRWGARARGNDDGGSVFPSRKESSVGRAPEFFFHARTRRDIGRGRSGNVAVRRKRPPEECRLYTAQIIYLFSDSFAHRTFFLSLSFVSLSTYLCPTAKSCRTTNFR